MNNKYIIELIATNCKTMRDYLNLMTINKTMWKHAKECSYNVYKAKRRFMLTPFIVNGKVVACKVKDGNLKPSHIEVYLDQFTTTTTKPDVFSFLREVRQTLRGKCLILDENTYFYEGDRLFGCYIGYNGTDAYFYCDGIVDPNDPIRTPEDELYSNTDGMEFHF